MKKGLIVLCILLLIFGLYGCSGFKNYEKTTNGMLKEVSCHDNLYYDTETKIIYIMLNESCGNTGYGYMSPYYSENGKLCKYINEKITEVND